VTGPPEYVEKQFSLHLLGDALKRLLKTPDQMASRASSQVPSL
jgi:hypothetical protein